MNPYMNVVGEAIAGAVEGLGKTAVSAIDATQRRKFDEALAAMSVSEQREINRQMLSAKTQIDKVRVILDTIQRSEVEKQRQAAMTRNIVIIGGVVIVLAGILVIALKK